MDNIIGIDIGTTHCKLVIVNKKNGVIFSSKKNCRSFTDETGKHEQDAEEIFNNATSLLNEAFKHTSQELFACISFSTAMHSLLAVNENGKPLMNAMTWADTRAAKYAKDLKESDGSASIYEQTGTPIHAMTPLCKLLWLKETQPNIFEKAFKFISIKEYIINRLFRKYIVDYSIASATGLFNIHTKQWNEDSLRIAGITADKLSQPVEIYHVEENASPEIRNQIGLTTNIPFIMGCSDGSAAQLGSGALLENDVCVTIGTSGAVRTFIHQPITNPQQKTFTYLLQDDWYLNGGATNNGGNAVQWFAKIFLPGTKDEECYEKIVSLAKQSEAGAKGLLFVPYLYGERAPVWDADATGQFTGIKNIHSVNDFARAVLEGVLLNVYEIFQSLPNQATADTVYANGGFFNNDFMAQLLADIFGIKVLLQKDADSSVMGAVYLGMLYKGWIKDIKEIKQFITADKIFTAAEGSNKLYNSIFENYISLRK